MLLRLSAHRCPDNTAGRNGLASSTIPHTKKGCLVAMLPCVPGIFRYLALP